METKSSEASEAETLSDEERQRWDPMAKDLYERYGQSVGWRAVKGLMPPWAEVRENRRVHGAWCIVARHSTLPKTMPQALDRFAACAPVRALLGEEFFQTFLRVKQRELDAFESVVTPWEREHLLLKA